MLDLSSRVEIPWDVLESPSPFAFTRDDLIATIRNADGIDVCNIVWGHGDYPDAFGFTVTGNVAAAFGRFLMAIMYEYQSTEIMQEFVNRVVVDYTNPYSKVVYFPRIDIEDED